MAGEGGQKEGISDADIDMVRKNPARLLGLDG
jgi:hypothetical protein